jgi:diguanylate cyclase (GGDEF)-like protein
LELVVIDRFKAVNHALGHAAGDDLRRRVTGRPTDCVQAEDTLARLVGNEFGVGLSGLIATTSAAIGQRIATTLSDANTLGTHTGWCVSASVGVVVR